jgi:hypothetical protein
MGSYGLALWAMTQAPLAWSPRCAKPPLFGALLAFNAQRKGCRITHCCGLWHRRGCDLAAPVLIILATKLPSCLQILPGGGPLSDTASCLSHYCGRFLSHFTVMAAPYSLFIFFKTYSAK